jgi:hypothetical protein
MQLFIGGRGCIVGSAFVVVKRGLTNSVYLTLRKRWTRGAVVHGDR